MCMILSPPCEKISCVLGPYGIEEGGGRGGVGLQRYSHEMGGGGVEAATL
jgi:hypothetical protein